jgi:hypothetical protein
VPAPNKFEFPLDAPTEDNLRAALERGYKRPTTLYTQGGSSRKGRPARVAAVNADVYRNNRTGVPNG